MFIYGHKSPEDVFGSAVVQGRKILKGFSMIEKIIILMVCSPFVIVEIRWVFTVNGDYMCAQGDASFEVADSYYENPKTS